MGCHQGTNLLVEEARNQTEKNMLNEWLGSAQLSRRRSDRHGGTTKRKSINRSKMASGIPLSVSSVHFPPIFKTHNNSCIKPGELLRVQCCRRYQTYTASWALASQPQVLAWFPQASHLPRRYMFCDKPFRTQFVLATWPWMQILERPIRLRVAASVDASLTCGMAPWQVGQTQLALVDFGPLLPLQAC
jgi:hypothetical protein